MGVEGFQVSALWWADYIALATAFIISLVMNHRQAKENRRLHEKNAELMALVHVGAIIAIERAQERRKQQREGEPPRKEKRTWN